jgi:hypothetical protein
MSVLVASSRLKAIHSSFVSWNMEVVGEAILVAADSARQRPGLDAGELGEVGVEHYLAFADDHDSLVNCRSGLSQVTRGSSLGRQAFVRAKAPPALHTD